MKRQTALCTSLAALLTTFALTAEAGAADPGARPTQQAFAGRVSTAEYKNFSASERRAYTLAQTTPYRRLPSLFGENAFDRATAKAKALFKLLKPNLKQSFDHHAPTMGHGALGRKMVHTNGVTAPVEVTLGGKTWEAIARFSLATPPEKSFVPAIALKLFNEPGREDHNIFLMNSPLGQGPDHNFFTKVFRNWFVKPERGLSKSLDKVDDAFAKIKADTNRIVLPKPLLAAGGLEPGRDIEAHHTDLAKAMTGDSSVDFRTALTTAFDQALRASAGSGFVISKLFTTEVGGAPGAIPDGQIKVVGPAVASKYGDTELFFRHNRNHE